MVMRATRLINEIKTALFHRCMLAAAIFLHSFFEILRVNKILFANLQTLTLIICIYANKHLSLLHK